MSVRPWPLRLSNIIFCSPLSALSCLTYVCRHGVADIRSRISSAFSSAYPQVVLNVNIYAYRAPRRGCPSMHAYCQTSICNTIHRTREKFFNGSFVARLRGCSGLPTTSIYILHHHVWHLLFLQNRPLMPLYISIYISVCYSQHLTTTNLIFFFIKNKKISNNLFKKLTI